MEIPRHPLVFTATLQRVELGYDDGVTLAIQMFRDCQIAGTDELVIDHSYRKGRPQDGCVRRYMEMVAGTADLCLKDGFYSVLTDFLGSTLGDSQDDLCIYEKLLGYADLRPK